MEGLEPSRLTAPDPRTTITFVTKIIELTLSLSTYNTHVKAQFFVCSLDLLLTILKVITSIRKLVDYVLPQILLYWLCLPRQ